MPYGRLALPTVSLLAQRQQGQSKWLTPSLLNRCAQETSRKRCHRICHCISCLRRPHAERRSQTGNFFKQLCVFASGCPLTVAETTVVLNFTGAHSCYLISVRSSPHQLPSDTACGTTSIQCSWFSVTLSVIGVKLTPKTEKPMIVRSNTVSVFLALMLLVTAKSGASLKQIEVQRAYCFQVSIDLLAVASTRQFDGLSISGCPLLKRITY